MQDDIRHIGPRFHVVQNGRFFKEPFFGGANVLDARDARFSLNGGHERGRFSADKGSAAAANLDREVKTGSQYIFAEQSQGFGIFNRFYQMFDGKGVFVADVNVPLAGPNRVSAEDEPLNNGVRVSLHQAAIHKRPRVAFVTVDQHIADVSR